MGGKRTVPSFVQKKIDMVKQRQSQTINRPVVQPSQGMSYSQSQPSMHYQEYNWDLPLDLPKRPPPERRVTPKSKLRTRAGNMLYKSVKEGNQEVENQPGMPKYYNNNYPIQAMTTYGNRKTKGKICVKF